MGFLRAGTEPQMPRQEGTRTAQAPSNQLDWKGQHRQASTDPKRLGRGRRPWRGSKTRTSEIRTAHESSQKRNQERRRMSPQNRKLCRNCREAREPIADRSRNTHARQNSHSEAATKHKQREIMSTEEQAECHRAEQRAEQHRHCSLGTDAERHPRLPNQRKAQDSRAAASKRGDQQRLRKAEAQAQKQ